MDLYNFLYKINSNNDLIFTSTRTVITYIYAVFLIRFGNPRFQLNTPMDLIFIIIIGAVFGRTIYGGASLISTFLSAAILIFLHGIFSYFSFINKSFGKIVKGSPIILIQDGQFQLKRMQKNSITKEDLEEICRKQFHHEDLTKINIAILERTGEITLIPKN